MCFDVGRVYQFFKKKLMCFFDVFVMSYTYLLNIKLLFRLTIVALLGYCEFIPNVTSVRIYVC